MERFEADKARALGDADSSRKGSIDEAIVPLLKHINSMPAYYTTSSCSGRISVYCPGQNLKKGCRWLMTSHESVLVQTVQTALVNLSPDDEGYVWFKFEPFVLHLMCRTLEDAQHMLQLAIGSGFRNSGVTLGKKGRILLAIRSTHCLQAPVAHNGSILASQEYLEHLVHLGNVKMAENLQRVEQFHKLLEVTSSKNEPKPHRQQANSSRSSRQPAETTTNSSPELNTASANTLQPSNKSCSEEALFGELFETPCT